MESKEKYQHFQAQPVRSDVQMEELIYSEEVLTYLLSLLTSEDKEILEDIYVATLDNILHYQKTKVRDYKRLRFRYEVSWGKLEAQGLIYPHKVGTMRVFSVTENGKRAVEKIKSEQR